MLWRRRLAAVGESVASPAMILWVRRVAIVCVLLGAYGILPPDAQRADARVHRHAVAGRGGAVRAGHHRRGVLARSASRAGVTGGLAAGFVIWMYTLLIPSIVADGGSPRWVIYGPFGSRLADAAQAFSASNSPITFPHGVFWSLAGERRRHGGAVAPLSPGDRRAAARGGRAPARRVPGTRGVQLLPGGATVGDLLVLAERLLGAPAARRLLERRSRELKRHVFAEERADLALLQSLERDLSGALGATSARLGADQRAARRGIELAEIVTLFDEASQKLRFNRELLETMMDNMPQGVAW